MSVNPGYTRRKELICTLAEAELYAAVVLYAGETIYIKQADGRYGVKIGDGETALSSLPYSINYGDINTLKTAAETAKSLSEAWAEGTVGGVDVETTHAAYHKNAKYYAALAAATLASKANIDGFYDQMSVRDAGALRGRGDGVAAEYTYRTTGGSADVADGAATMQSIKGNTLVWNQLVNNTASTQTINGITFTNNGDGSWTVNGTATDDTSKTVSTGSGRISRTMCLIGCPIGGSLATYYVQEGWTGSRDFGDGKRFVSYTSGVYDIKITVKSGTTVTNLVFRPQLFDLTQMFGAGNEPTGENAVAEFKALFPKDYYPFDAGSLLSVNATGIKTVGFNQLPSGGTWSGDSTIVYSEPLKLFNGKAYNYSDTLPTHNSSWGFKYYDKDGNYIDGQSVYYGELITTDMPSGTESAKLLVWSSGNATIPTKPCVNISWSGYRNGEHEDYWTQTRDIDLSNFDVTVGDTVYGGLKAVGDVYDEQTKDKDIRRINVINMGDMTWTAYGSVPGMYSCALNDKSVGYINIKSTIFTPKNAALNTDYPDLCMRGLITSGTVYVRYVGKNTVEEFTRAVTNIPLLYELASPVETPHNPALNLSYQVSDFGTEEVVTADGEMTAPIKTDIVYGLNVVDTIRRLDENYVSTGEQTLDATQKAQVLSNLGISNMARCVDVPASVSAIGTKGNIAVADGYLYVCVATNTWQRVALSTW